MLYAKYALCRCLSFLGVFGCIKPISWREHRWKTGLLSSMTGSRCFRRRVRRIGRNGIVETPTKRNTAFVLECARQRGTRRRRFVGISISSLLRSDIKREPPPMSLSLVTKRCRLTGNCRFRCHRTPGLAGHEYPRTSVLTAKCAGSAKKIGERALTANDGE